MNYKKSALVLAMSTSLGLGAITAEAALITASWDGLFTHLGPTGAALANSSEPYYSDPTWGNGLRSQISGTFTFDTSTGAGSMTVNPFDFFSGGLTTFHSFTLQAIGDGVGGAGTLIAGGFMWDWNSTTNITVGIVLDAAGFFGALPAGTSAVISGVGAIPASNTTNNGTNNAPFSAPAIGPAPIATTTWNTDFNVNPGCVLTNSCLTSNDTIGGDPMDNGPTVSLSANFDFTSIHIDSVTMPNNQVPVPAAAWLFGSGLLGLLGVARRKQLRCELEV